LKFSYRQILASAGGAVLSAVIASIFGVKGTIVGVAIGSVAATTGSALLFQSIERTNQAVKQVVVRAPESSKLLRRLGGTATAGVAESAPAGSSTLTEEPVTSAASSDAAVSETSVSAAVPPPEDQTAQLPAAPAPPAAGGSALRWPVVAAVVVGVFVFSLLLVTGIELIAGRPLADLFGGHSSGTSVGGVFKSPTTTLPPPTTTTTSPTTTTTSTSSSTTSTVGGSSTTSTGVGSTSTSLSSGTTTSAPGSGPTTTNAAGTG
jgi:hypothetical protein